MYKYINIIFYITLNVISIIIIYRVAESARSGEGVSLIAKAQNIRYFVCRNYICRDLRAFSRVILPSFDGSTNIYGTCIEQKSYR